MADRDGDLGADRGAEFRDDRRGRGQLPPGEIKRLSRLDGRKAALSLATTWGVIALTLGTAITWPHPVVIVAAIVLIATRQQALFVLAHDAAHYRLFANRTLNDAVGWLCAAPCGISMHSYRVIHRLHHNHLYDARDPDLPLHAGYPRGRAYLVRKLLKDLSGLTAIKTYRYFFGAPDGAATADDSAPGLRDAARRDRWSVTALHGAMLAAAFAGGWGVPYLLLWVLPLVTVLQAILRLRALCEHGAVTDLSSPLTAARTTTAGPLVRWLLFPHHVNYHTAHHAYPAVPHYNLPACHAAMADRGLLDRAEITPVRAVLARVFADPPPATLAAE